MLPWYRNQSVDLLCKSIGWFLCSVNFQRCVMGPKTFLGEYSSTYIVVAYSDPSQKYCQLFFGKNSVSVYLRCSTVSEYLCIQFIEQYSFYKLLKQILGLRVKQSCIKKKYSNIWCHICLKCLKVVVRFPLFKLNIISFLPTELLVMYLVRILTRL